MDLTRDLVDILTDIISIESETDNEKEICDTIFSALENCSGELLRENNSLVYKTDYNKDKTIALVGHIDTVPVNRSSTNPTVKDGFIWGRGACDMKAGVAVMLKIIDDLEKGKITPNFNLTFVFYEGEEGPIPNGINTLLDKNLLGGTNFAYILEPTESRYSMGCLGSIAAKKEFTGVSAHSANPRTGENSISQAMESFRKIEHLNSKIGADCDIDGLGYYETVNITTMNTFNAFNVIPPRAEVTINYRFSPLRKADEVISELEETIGKEGLTILDKAESCYIGSDGDSFLQEGVEKEIMQAWTDMAQLCEAGIPAINYGPGSIKHAHKPDERVSISELELFYTKMISHL